MTTIVPLLHAAVTHFPIAFLILASASGLAYLHWKPRNELKVLTWWPMLLGWLALLPSIVSGLFAQGGLPPDAPYRSILNWHITTGLLLVVVYGDPLYRRWLSRSRRNRARRRAQATVDPPPDLLDDPKRRWPLTAQLILGIGLVLATGRLGGELVSTWGVNVGG
jgi:uncharacterized membrane protein